MQFESYPFEKLSTLLADIHPSRECDSFALTIGEPQFETPSFIQQAFSKEGALLRKYPKSGGEDYLKESQRAFIKSRFNLTLKPEELLPTFGTREALFNLPQYLLFDKTAPLMAYPNPFYQIYEGAAIASRAKTLLMDLTRENHFTPHLNPDALKACDLVILNSPNNPTGSALTLQELKQWVEAALEFNFILINDECYSEIYMGEPPHSLLEASVAAGNESFKNILVVNSLSKRSSSPGLRSGFVAGDSTLLRGYAAYRTYLGCAIPLPLQKAAAAAWDDQEHPKIARQKYQENHALAQEILQCTIPPYTFYVWLEVGDDLQFTQKLYQQEGVMVLPGSFLGRKGAGTGFVRLALVHKPSIIQEALKKVARCLKS